MNWFCEDFQLEYNFLIEGRSLIISWSRTTPYVLIYMDFSNEPHAIDILEKVGLGMSVLLQLEGQHTRSMAKSGISSMSAT